MTTRLTDAELQTALTLAEKATAGPWTVHTQLGIDDLTSPDTAFIAAAREGWPAAAQALLKARAAMDAALARLMDMRTLNMNDPDWPHTGSQAQTIGGDAWRILDEARKGA